MSVESDVKILLRDVLQLGDRVDMFDIDTALLGSIPEFDSMAVVSLVTAIEDHFGIMLDDEDITAENFETLGTLMEVVEHRLES